MRRMKRRREEFNIENWSPVTALGKAVKAGELVSISQVLDSGKPILEAEIVDALLPSIDDEFINVGQAKGKFGGGKRRPMKQTQKKTAEGSKISFTTVAVVGNKNGYVGVGYGKAGETVPAKEKSLKIAKKNIIEVVRGCGSWECGCGEPHSLPFVVEGKCSSVKVKLLPAPKGTGLCVENELKKILKLAGYQDVWSKVTGQSSHKQNLVKACMHALKKGVNARLIDSRRAKIVFGAREGIIEIAKPVALVEENGKQ